MGLLTAGRGAQAVVRDLSAGDLPGSRELSPPFEQQVIVRLGGAVHHASAARTLVTAQGFLVSTKLQPGGFSTNLTDCPGPANRNSVAECWKCWLGSEG